MKAYTDEIGSWLAGAAVPSKLKVVIAYADLSSATLAKRILHEALAVLSLQFTVETSLWKFELLQAPSLQQLAMEDAAQAQIIIIAAEREYGLPDGAKKWVETCLTNPEVKDVSVVALLRDDQGDSLESPLLAGFERFSDNVKTDLFWFIANEDEGSKLAADKIIQLACQIPVIDGMECVA